MGIIIRHHLNIILVTWQLINSLKGLIVVIAISSKKFSILQQGICERQALCPVVFIYLLPSRIGPIVGGK